MARHDFSIDLAPLPTHAFGRRSLTWWGIIAFFLIEGTAFALAIAAYFYLMNLERAWPPPSFLPPNLIAGTLFTIVMLLSEVPNTLAKKASEALDLRGTQRWLIVMSVIGTLLLVLHTVHIGTDWVDTLVLTALMHTRYGTEARRFVDCSENAMYWRFVWIAWLPIYLLIYWVPRWA